jgi:PAS domain S-box-containing protein
MNQQDLRTSNPAPAEPDHQPDSNQLELLLQEQRNLLEIIASGQSVEFFLKELCAVVPRLDPRARACILLADEMHRFFVKAVAPDLGSFGSMLEGAPIDDQQIGTCGEALFRGSSISCADIHNDLRWSEAWRNACLEQNILACHSEPIRDHEGNAIGSFMLCFDEPRMPNQWDRRLVAFAIHLASVAIESDRSCAALVKSQERYATLLNSIDTGFCVLQILFNDKGIPYDQIYLETNSLFEEQTGLKDAIGRNVNELIPDLDPEWFRIYGGVALTGEPVRFEKDALGRWYDIYAYRVDAPKDRRVALLFKDISERKQAEMNLAFLASFSEDMANASRIQHIMDTVGVRIGEFLGLSACSFAEINPEADQATIISDWHRDDTPRISGIYPFSDFLSDDFRATCMRGDVFVADDTSTDPRTETGAFHELSIGAMLCVPLIDAGRWSFLLCVFHSQPHKWSSGEIKLVEELTARIWSRLERGRTEEALHKSEEKLRQIFEGAKDYAIISFDLDGHFISWNPGAARLFGYEEHEVLGHHVEMIFTPSDRLNHIPSMEMDLARQVGVAEDERWHQRKDGSLFYASGLTQPIFDTANNLTGYTKIAQDRTANYEAKKALERELTDNQRLQEISTRLIAEGDFEALVGEILLAAITVTHADMGAIQLVEGEAGETLRLLDSKGYSLETIHGIDQLSPADHPEYINSLRRGGRIVTANLHDSPIFSGSQFARLLKQAGANSLQSTPLISRSGRFLGIISNQWRETHEPEGRELRLLDLLARQAADLIERHQSEIALREQKQELLEISLHLEQRVAQRTEELQTQTARLQNLAVELASAEQRERKRLAALLHDDLQQLLVAASMQLDSISRNQQDAVNISSVERAAKWIEQAAAAARDLTRQLRPPALYEDGLIPALHWLASEMKERHNLEVVIDGGEAARTLSDDIKALLFECVRELVFNCAKYARVNHSTVTVRELRNSLRIVVTDCGCGFDVDTLSIPRKSGRFGLFSIRERLTALGGQLTIESAPGKGTRIELEAPLPSEDSTGEMKIPPLTPTTPLFEERAAVATDQRTRILVVDDHPMVREGIANILDSDRRLVVSGQAADGFEAIQAIERHRPDVVLMDVNMPRLNGIEATRRIRQRWPQTLIIGLSVQDDETTAKSMLDAGATSFISKSGDSERIINAILQIAPHKALSTRSTLLPTQRAHPEH